MIDSRISQINLKHLIFGADPSFDNDGNLKGMVFKFYEKNKEEVYTKSYKHDFQVASAFHHLKLEMDTRQLISFMATLVEGISTYLYNIRYELAGEEHLETNIKLTPNKRGDNDYMLRITNNRKKVRKFDKNDKESALTRYKVMMAVHAVDGDKEYELVELRFSKRDVLLMLNMIKSIVSQNYRVFNFIYANATAVDSDKDVLSNPDLMSISKIDNSIVFGQTFLHGQEILNLNYVVESLIFGHNVESRLRSMLTSFRQIEVFEYNKYILGLKVRKMRVSRDAYTDEEKHEFEEDDAGKELMFNNRLLAGLFLFMTPGQLRHSTSVSGNNKDKFGKKVLYHINLRESDIAVGFNSSPSLKTAKKTGNEYMNFFSISLITKNGMFEDEKKGYIKHFLPGVDEPTYVPSIDKLTLGLHGRWVHFLETMTRANNSEFDDGETIIRKRLHIIKAEPGGQKKYTIGLYSDSENKAPVVLSVEKYDKNGENIEGKFRQPMFKKYIKEFLMISMQSAFELENFSFTSQKELSEIVGVKYDGLKTVRVKNYEMPDLERIPDGNIVKIGIEKVNNMMVKVGNFKEDDKFCLLDYNDIISLNISAANRIMNGQWIPFVGEQIAISQDGYLTDLFSEVNLEDRGMGAFHAWQYFFGTAIR